MSSRICGAGSSKPVAVERGLEEVVDSESGQNEDNELMCSKEVNQKNIQSLVTKVLGLTHSKF